MTALLLALVLLAPPAPAAPAAPADTVVSGAAPERDLLLEFRLGREASRLIPALERGGQVYLPAVEVLEVAGVAFMVTAPGSIQGYRHPGGRPFLIDAESGALRFDSRDLDGVPVLSGGRVFVPLPALASLLDTPIDVDWTELVAVAREPGHLPAPMARAREARWARFQPMAPGSRTPAEVILPPARYRVGGGVLDWSLSSDLRDPAGSAVGSALLGTQLLGGSLQLSAVSAGPLADGAIRGGASYVKSWGGAGLLPRQLHLGDALSSGPRPRALRGVRITNAPRHRDAHFGTESFTGRLGPGWTVELRQQGRVLDLARADEQGAYALDIPLVYGLNPVQVVGYGPHGEVVTLDRLVHLRGDRLPRGTLEWSLSAGACPSVRACAGSGNVDLRYGLTGALTLRTGVEVASREERGTVVLPYAELSATPWLPLTLGAEFLHGASRRGTLHFTPTSDLRVRGAWTRFDGDPARSVFHDPTRRSTAEVDVHVRLPALGPRLSTTLSWVRESRFLGAYSRTRAIAALDQRMGRLEAGVQLQRWEAGDGAMEVRPLVGMSGPLPGRGWYRGEVQFLGTEELDRALVRVTPVAGALGRLELGAQWSREVGTEFVVGLSAQAGGARTVTQALATPDRIQGVNQFAHGTLVWDEAMGRLRAGNAPRVERGGVAGIVFLDENGNGRRDADEPGISGVRVVIEGRTVTTDDEGRYYLDDLLPWEPARIEILHASLAHPLWAPAVRSVDVTLSPSSVRRVDLAVVRGGEIRGRVVRETGGRETPVAGVSILLVDLSRGGRTVEVTTFADGRFYAMGLAPGGYEVRVTPGSLRGLGVEPDVPRRAVVIDPSGENGGSELIIRLVPTPDPGP